MDQIPSGNYAILEGTTVNGEPRFRLEPYDAVWGDDTHNASGRSLFRLHGPGRSTGCITACDASNWGVVRDLIRDTSTSSVNVQQSKNFAPGGARLFSVPVGTERLKYYGTLRVD